MFIVLIGVFMGTRPHKHEMTGILLAIIGCIFMVMDPNAARTGGQQATVMPALLDAGSAFFGALYFMMSARNVKQIPICYLVLLMSSHTFLLNSFLAKVQDPTIEIFSVSPT
jgi:drug/metabolite transporter (DMT)-like permease